MGEQAMSHEQYLRALEHDREQLNLFLLAVLTEYEMGADMSQTIQQIRQYYGREKPK